MQEKTPKERLNAYTVDSVYFGCRIPRRLRDRLVEEANLQRRSASSQVAAILDERYAHAIGASRKAAANDSH